MRMPALCLALLVPAPVIAQGEPFSAPLGISSQGRLFEEVASGVQLSPAGTLRLEAKPLEGDFHHVAFELNVRTASGVERRIPRVEANGFLATDLDRIVAIEAPESSTAHTFVRVLGLDGEELWSSEEHGVTDATLSPDGTWLAWRTAGHLSALDLATFERREHPDLAAFALGAGGRLVGAGPGSEVVVRQGPDEARVFRVPGRVLRTAFDPAGRTALALTTQALFRIDPLAGDVSVLQRRQPGFELRDLHVRPNAVSIGMRRRVGNTATGWRLQFATIGGASISASGTTTIPHAQAELYDPDGIAWPLSPNAQHPIGNTYGEYQNYGGSPYLHPGIDVLGNPGQPVYAVEGGVVKAVLTTSGSFHWRVATGQPGAGTSTGYLYAHLDLPTIAVNVGDTITKGQYLGDLVFWPVADFTHCHFARIEDTGSNWSGDWLCTDSPHPDLKQQGDVEAPVFENAVPGALFAFCNNQTSSYQNPNSLSGAVDIVAHVGDRIDSNWVCSVQDIRYTIHPVGAPGAPIVDNRLAVDFDMALDTYQNGPIDPFLVGLFYKEDSTCDTDGDYSSREFFHIITNSNGDQVYDTSDLGEAWDTALLPDGDYVVRVTARDTAGNSTTAAMTVTTDNGNP